MILNNKTGSTLFQKKIFFWKILQKNKHYNMKTIWKVLITIDQGSISLTTKLPRFLKTISFTLKYTVKTYDLLNSSRKLYLNLI